ncbi:MAG: hypothetical protein WDO06_01810 [Actinomycetota bacterium]
MRKLVRRLRSNVRGALFSIFKIWLRVRPTTGYLSCAGRSDGGGAQLHATLSTQLLCNDFKIQYLHTPFSSIEHKPANWSEKEWLEKWENYLDLGDGFPTRSQIDYKNFEIVSAKSPLEAVARLLKNRSRKVIVEVRECHDYADRHAKNYQSIISKYQTDQKSPIIAVHVRRGDVTSSHQTFRFTSAENIKSHIGQVINDFPNNENEVVLYSASSDSDLTELSKFDWKLDTSSNVFEVLNALRSAEIQVMSKSSLSYIGALFSSGVVYYQRFWHSPLPGWKLLK